MANNFTDYYEEEFLTKSGKVILWKLAADINLNSESKRKKDAERQEILRMINKLGYPIKQICYKKSGQPILEDVREEYISISHSKGWFALYIGKVSVGIDIEIEREKIGNGKEWFMNEFELENFYSNDELHIIWCAKEALFKLMEGLVIEPKNEFTVKNIGLETVKILYNSLEFLFYYKKIRNSFVVWS